MRLAALPLAFVLFAASPAAAQRSQPAQISGHRISINGAGQASLVDRRQYVVRPYVIVSSDGWRHELRTIDRRIRRAREDGELTRGQARALRRQVAMIRSVGDAYAANGYSESELAALNAQTFALRDLAQAPNRPVPASRR
jgi:hypothetical protein